MIILKIIIDLICGALFSLGGWKIIQLRRFAMPVVLGIGVSIITHTWWTGIMVLPVMGTLCEGYFKITNQFFARGLWLAMQAFVIGIGVTLTGHLGWYFYIPYVLIAGVLAGLLYGIQQIIGDLIFGGWLGIIIFFLK